MENCSLPSDYNLKFNWVQDMSGSFTHASKQLAENMGDTFDKINKTFQQANIYAHFASFVDEAVNWGPGGLMQDMYCYQYMGGAKYGNNTQDFNNIIEYFKAVNKDPDFDPWSDDSPEGSLKALFMNYLRNEWSGQEDPFFNDGKPIAEINILFTDDFPKDSSMESYQANDYGHIRTMLDQNPFVLDVIRNEVNTYDKNDRIDNTDICYSLTGGGDPGNGPYIRPSFEQYCDEVNKTNQYTFVVIMGNNPDPIHNYFKKHLEEGRCEHFDVVTIKYLDELADSLERVLLDTLCVDNIHTKPTGTTSKTNPTTSKTNPTDSGPNPTDSDPNPTDSSPNPTDSSPNPTDVEELETIDDEDSYTGALIGGIVSATVIAGAAVGAGFYYFGGSKSKRRWEFK